MKRIWVLVLAAAMLWMAGACAAGSGTGTANMENIAWTQKVTVGVGASLNEVTEWPDENRVLTFPAYLTEIGEDDEGGNG